MAPNATVLGKVTAGQDTSIWYASTLLGTVRIRIGRNCVIQDRAHLSREIKIGDNVFVGPNVVLQGSTLKDWAFVSMGSSVRHAIVEEGGCVAAGAVILDNETVREGEVRVMRCRFGLEIPGGSYAM